jgi:hypothetical protein
MPGTSEQLRQDPAARRAIGWRRDPVRLCSLALFAVVGVALSEHFAAYLSYAWTEILYPFGIDYGEGIVWQQAMLIPGPRMYGAIDHYPFIVFHYPPVYHLVLRAAAALGLPVLAAGRGVSVLASLAIAASVGGLVFSHVRCSAGRAVSVASAAIAGSTVFTMVPFWVSSALVRVDMPAIAISLAGMLCGVAALRRPWLLYPAVAAFVLAVYTKQTALAAPCATLPVLWLVHPRHTARAAAAGLAAALAMLLLLSLATDGGFLRHIVLYNVNRYDMALIGEKLRPAAPEAIYLALAVIAALLGWSRFRADATAQPGAALRLRLTRDPASAHWLVFTLYLGISTAMLASLGKSGGGINYLVEWMCVWSVLIGSLIGSVLAAVAQPPAQGWTAGSALPCCLVPFLLALQVINLPAPWLDHVQLDADMREMAALQATVRAATRPVLSVDMVLLMQAGKPVPIEPAIFAELASLGRWDERPFIRMIDDHAFAFVIIGRDDQARMIDQRFTPAVRAAIEQAYPRVERQAGFIVRWPAAGA